MQSEFPLEPSEDLFDQYQRLKGRKDLLENVFNSLQIGMSVFEPVYDDFGRILDFRLVITNKEVERQTGRTDLPGIHYAQEYPGIKEVGIFSLMLEVMETGEPADRPDLLVGIEDIMALMGYAQMREMEKRLTTLDETLDA